MVFSVNHYRTEVLPDVHFFTLDVLVKVLKGNKNAISFYSIYLFFFYFQFVLSELVRISSY